MVSSLWSIKIKKKASTLVCPCSRHRPSWPWGSHDRRWCSSRADRESWWPSPAGQSLAPWDHPGRHPPWLLFAGSADEWSGRLCQWWHRPIHSEPRFYLRGNYMIRINTCPAFSSCFFRPSRQPISSCINTLAQTLPIDTLSNIGTIYPYPIMNDYERISDFCFLL